MRHYWGSHQCNGLQSKLLISLRSPDDQDYVAVPPIPLFANARAAASHRECVSIAIANDSILEDTESFDVMLSSGDSIVRFTQQTSRVYIIDDDGVRVGLRERTMEVSEEGEAVPLCVELVGRFEGNIEVTLESQPDSAEGELGLPQK